MSIILKNIKKTYSGKTLFVIPTFEVDTGFTCIAGPSGCGKTTLGRIIAGIENYDSGEIIGIKGVPTVLFQESRLIPSLSAEKNISIVCRSKNNSLLGKKLLQELLFTKEDLNKLPSELSGGMIRRVAIVRAIVFALENSGNFVLLDEPFSGLDPETKAKAAYIISEHLHDKHVLIITHAEDDTELFRGKLVNFSDLTQ